MSVIISEQPLAGEPQTLTPAGTVSLRWLGQAGFEIYTSSLHIMIDPYLSDSLAKKYAGKEFAHQRLMPPPMQPAEVQGLDLLLCTHRHSDHLDPQTAPLIMQHNPACLMIAPRAERGYIESLGIDLSRVILTNAAESIKTAGDLVISVIPSAHEELSTDASGNHHFLGYVLSCEGLNIYHSGDCVPFARQSSLLQDLAADVALLPINGRDEFRRSRGVPGNMTLREAVELCRESEIAQLICHHFGMFSFNTASMSEAAAFLATLEPTRLQVTIPAISTSLHLRRQDE